MLPILGYHGNRLAVVLRDDAKQDRMPIRLKRDLFTKAELQHRRVRAHLMQKPEPRDDPVVQVNQCGLGQSVDVDWHGVCDTVSRLPETVTCYVIPEGDLMATSVAARVQKRRDSMRKAGLRPAQIWVPDTRRPNFAAECRRQSRLAAKADRADRALLKFMDVALADVDGWAA